MLDRKYYKNGQKVYDYGGSTLTYFYKSGVKKASRPFIDNRMEGEWMFWRETGQLWQIGNFRNNMKHGLWVRYDREGREEYREIFENNKPLKKQR